MTRRSFAVAMIALLGACHDWDRFRLGTSNSDGGLDLSVTAQPDASSPERDLAAFDQATLDFAALDLAGLDLAGCPAFDPPPPADPSCKLYSFEAGPRADVEFINSLGVAELSYECGAVRIKLPREETRGFDESSIDSARLRMVNPFPSAVRVRAHVRAQRDEYEQFTGAFIQNGNDYAVVASGRNNQMMSVERDWWEVFNPALFTHVNPQPQGTNEPSGLDPRLRTYEIAQHPSPVGMDFKVSAGSQVSNTFATTATISPVAYFGAVIGTCCTAISPGIDAYVAWVEICPVPVN